MTDNEVDNIYVNVSISNLDTTYDSSKSGGVNFTHHKEAVYNEYKTNNILDNPENYYCAITRFTIPLDTPIMQMPVLKNNPTNDPDITPLIFGCRFNNVNYQTNIIYFCVNGENKPTNSTSQDSAYYFLYSYDLFLFSINKTLVSWWNTPLNPPNPTPTLATLTGGYDPPYFSFNKSTDLFSLTLPAPFVTTYPNPPSTSNYFFMNDLLYYYFSSLFTNSSYNVGNMVGHMNIMNISPNPIEPTSYVVGARTYYTYTQNYSSISNIQAVRRLLITSNTIPIRQEIVQSNISSYASSGLPIISDFVPQIINAGDSQTVAFYQPSGKDNYRIIDMMSNIPLKSIDLKIFWEDNFGYIHPLILDQGSIASIKIGFFKKSLYKNK